MKVLSADVWVEHARLGVFVGEFVRVWIDRDGHLYECCYPKSFTDKQAKNLFCYQMNSKEKL